MKKIIFLTVLFLCCFTLPMAVTGESGGVQTIRETITQDQPSFSFRNGVHWDMTPDLVKSIETEDMTELQRGEWSVTVTAEPVAVSLFTADLVFIFRNNALKMITYEFRKRDDVSLDYQYQYINGALSTVYGDGQESSPETIKALMDLIYPDRFSTEKIRQPVEWTYGDGTHVYLYYFSEEHFAILYTAPGAGRQDGGYAVNGL